MVSILNVFASLILYVESFFRNTTQTYITMNKTKSNTDITTSKMIVL